MTTPTKTLNLYDNEDTMRALVTHAITNKWPFGGHHSKDGGWTLAVPADRYGEFLRLRDIVQEITR